jgi:hypothetical protein
MRLSAESTEDSLSPLPDVEKEFFEQDKKDHLNVETRLIAASGGSIRAPADVEKDELGRVEQPKRHIDALSAQHTEVLDELGLRLVEDGFVKWKTDSSAHPRNWSTSRKIFDTMLIFLLDLFT